MTYSLVFLVSFVANKHTNPPKGSAINGSIVILASGLSANKTITVTGPIIDAKKLGKLVLSEDSKSLESMTSVFFFAKAIAIIIVTINAQIAGMIFTYIKDVRFSLNPSAVAIVFGLGLITLPAFPPPIIANKMLDLERFDFLPTARAIGAQVITEMSMNTPTAQIIIVEIAIAIKAFCSPNFLIIVSAIFSAAPVLTKQPAKIPLVIILRTELIIDSEPFTMADTVPTSPPPPISPPTKAPIISA